MKKLARILALTGLVLAVAGAARAGTDASGDTIRDKPWYVPSSGLTLGAMTTIRAGTDCELTGYAIADPFQINLEYQAGILDDDITNINTYLYPAAPAFPANHTDGTWSVNFGDNDEYVFNVSAGGGLTVYEYAGLAETVCADIEWTLTGWHQTILAGDIVDHGDGTITLRVLPVGTYRPFVNDPPVNNVEVFDGDLDTEVLGYTFNGAAGDIGNGSVFGVELVPEPATLALLGLGGLGVLIRRKRNVPEGRCR